MTFIWLRTWQLGAKSLLLHPLRSLLTVLGIFIGTASVIWLLAIGEGISAKAQEQIAQLGADNIILRSVQPTRQNSKSAFSIARYGLTRQDYDNLSTISSSQSSARIRETRSECKHGDNAIEARVVGCTAEYLDLSRLAVDQGHFVTDAELRDADNVCVLA